MNSKDQQQPRLPGLDEAILIHSVAPATAKRLVTNWRTAKHAATVVGHALARAGLAVVEMEASLDDAGQPMHVLHLDVNTGYRLAGVLAGSGGGGPPAPT